MSATTPTEQATAEADRTEAIKADEVINAKQGGAVEVHDQEQAQRNAVIDHAADVALAMPGVPGRDEFLALAMQARILCMSGAAPKEVRNNPYIAFHVAMVGRDLGISPSAALNLIDVIGEGDRVQLSLSPQLLNAQIRRLGLGKIIPVEQTTERCVARAIDTHGEVIGESEFTWQDAKTAGLVGRDCTPIEHKKDGQGKCGCKYGYKSYPKRMLWWRASGYCAADFFPEASVGLYTPEELGAVVDEEGRPIDPASVDLPEGYQPPERPPDPETTPADPASLWALQERVYALPAEARAELKTRWDASVRLRGWLLRNLTQSRVNVANSIIAGVESMAAKDGWQRDAALGEVRTKLAMVVGGIIGAMIGVGPTASKPEPQPEHETADKPAAPQPEPEGSTAADLAGEMDKALDKADPDRVDPVEKFKQETGLTDEYMAESNAKFEVTPAYTADVIAAVMDMDRDTRVTMLGERKLPTSGNLDSLGKRLAEALVAERWQPEAGTLL